MDEPIAAAGGISEAHGSASFFNPSETRVNTHHRQPQTGRWERRRAARHDVRRPVKVMDLLTQRFYVGMACNISETGLLVEFAGDIPVQVGQRVRFLVTNNISTVARRASMRSARVVRQITSPGCQGRVGLQVLPDFL